MELTRSMFVTTKAAICRPVEATGVPYTYVWMDYFFSYGLPSIGQVLAQAPLSTRPSSSEAPEQRRSKPGAPLARQHVVPVPARSGTAGDQEVKP
jgi:hypothetical protein